jgi:hypothetical protein
MNALYTKAVNATPLHRANWIKRSEKWRRLMVAARSGESRAHEQLLREEPQTALH